MFQSGSGFTNSNMHNSHGALRKSFHGYPLSKPARNNPGFTPANSPVYPEKAAAHRQMEEPDNMRPGRNSAKSSPPIPRNMKSFMAPTISAASKVLSPKKRVLSERNDAPFSGKTPPSKPSNPYFSGSENSIDRMDIGSFEPNNREFHLSFDKPCHDLDSESLADLSKDSDPRFLLIRPLSLEDIYRQREFENGSIFVGKENQGMPNSSSSKEAEKSPGRSLGERVAMVAATNNKEENSKPRNLQNKDNTFNGEKFMSQEKLHGASNMSLNEEKGQVVEEEDEEEGEEQQQQGTWSLRKSLWLVMLLLSASAAFIARNPGVLLENPDFDDVVTSNQSLVWSEMDGNHTEIQNGSEMTHQLEEGKPHEDDVLSDFEDDIHDEMEGLDEQDIEWEAYGFTSKIGKSNDFEVYTEIGNPIEEEDDEIMAQIESSNDLEELVPDMGIDYAFPELLDDSNDLEELVAVEGIIDAFPESATEEQELLPYSKAEAVEERDTKGFTDAYAEPDARENSEQDTIPTFSEKADNLELLAEQELLKDPNVEEYGYELLSAADDVQVYDTEHEESSLTSKGNEIPAEKEIKNSRVLTWVVMAVVTVLAAVTIQWFRSKISSGFSSSSSRPYRKKIEFRASSVPGKKHQEKEAVLEEKQDESQESSGTMQSRGAGEIDLCRFPPTVQLMTDYTLTDESRSRSRTRVSFKKRTASARCPFQTPGPAVAAAPEDSVSLGSYTTFENITTKQAEEEDAKLTPLGRSVRVNNKQATTQGKSLQFSSWVGGSTTEPTQTAPCSDAVWEAALATARNEAAKLARIEERKSWELRWETQLQQTQEILEARYREREQEFLRQQALKAETAWAQLEDELREQIRFELLKEQAACNEQARAAQAEREREEEEDRLQKSQLDHAHHQSSQAWLDTGRCPYLVLGINWHASWEELRRHIRRTSAKMHPDTPRSSESSEDRVAMFQRFQQAAAFPSESSEDRVAMFQRFQQAAAFLDTEDHRSTFDMLHAIARPHCACQSIPQAH